MFQSNNSCVWCKNIYSYASVILYIFPFFAVFWKVSLTLVQSLFFLSSDCNSFRLSYTWQHPFSWSSYLPSYRNVQSWSLISTSHSNKMNFGNGLIIAKVQSVITTPRASIVYTVRSTWNLTYLKCWAEKVTLTKAMQRTSVSQNFTIYFQAARTMLDPSCFSFQTLNYLQTLKQLA